MGCQKVSQQTPQLSLIPYLLSLVSWHGIHGFHGESFAKHLIGVSTPARTQQVFFSNQVWSQSSGLLMGVSMETPHPPHGSPGGTSWEALWTFPGSVYGVLRGSQRIPKKCPGNFIELSGNFKGIPGKFREMSKKFHGHFWKF